MKKIVEARGDACPLPVIKAKKGLAALRNGDSLLVYVDNAIAMENLLKLGGQLGIKAEGSRKDEGYEVEFFYCGETLNPSIMGKIKEEDLSERIENSTVAVVGSETMGAGDDILGKLLMKGFFYALTGLEEPPEAILFYNGGVRLTCEGSEVLPDLRELERQGSSILSCGTCLDYYQLKDKLCVGRVTNMYEIVEKQSTADRIIRP